MATVWGPPLVVEGGERGERGGIENKLSEREKKERADFHLSSF